MTRKLSPGRSLSGRCTRGLTAVAIASLVGALNPWGASAYYGLASITDTSMYVSGYVTVGGVIPSAAIEIAAFDEAGVLSGSSVIDYSLEPGQAVYRLNVYGDDESTGSDEGPSPGEPARIEVYLPGVGVYPAGAVVLSRGTDGQPLTADPPEFAVNSVVFANIDLLSIDDPDEDGLADYIESMIDTDPNDPDSDDDLVNDGNEVAAGTDPNNAADYTIATANNDVGSVAQDALPIAIYVLANDSDPDGTPTFFIESATQPANGTVVIDVDGLGLTYQPDPGYSNNGSPTDDFTYTLAPGGATASVSMTVQSSLPPAVPGLGGLGLALLAVGLAALCRRVTTIRGEVKCS